MKKIIAFLMTFCLIASSCLMLTGCDLLSQNSKKYYDSVVASVTDGTNTENITVSEVSSVFYQYYYDKYYYQNYSEQETYDIVLDLLLKNRILVLEAKKAVTLSIAQKNNVYEEVFDYVNTTLDTYEDEIRKIEEVDARVTDTEEKKELVAFETYKRPVPGETDEEVETVLVDTFKVPTEEDNYYRYLAYKKYCSVLLKSEQVYNKDASDGETSFKDEIARLYTYYENTAYLNAFLTNLKSKITISDEDILAKYNELLKTQMQDYSIESNFTSNVTSSSNNDLILYYPTNNYFSVQHILLKFTDEASEELKNHNGYVSSNTATSSVEQAIVDEFLELREKLGNNDADNELTINYINPTTGETNKDDNGVDNSASQTLVNIKSKINDIYSAYATVFNDAAKSATDKALATKKLCKDFYQLKWSYSQDNNVSDLTKLSNKVGFVFNTDSTVSNSWVSEFSKCAYDLYDEFLTTGKYDIKYAVTQYGLHIIAFTGMLPTGTITDGTIDGLKSTYVSSCTDQTVYDYIYELLLTEKETEVSNNAYTTYYNLYTSLDHINVKVSEYADLK